MPFRIAAIRSDAMSRDTGQAAVIGTDVNGTVVYWNVRAESLYGWRADEAMGRNILDLTPTRQSSDEAARIMERISRGEEWTGEFIVRRRDGTPVIAHVTDVPVIHEGEVVGIVGVSSPLRGSRSVA